MKKNKRIISTLCTLLLMCTLAGCVYNEASETGTAAEETAAEVDVSVMLAITDEDELAAVAAAKKKVAAMTGEVRIIATSPSVVDICDKLNLNLVGVPETSADLPEQYEGLPTVGTAMSPDTELLASLQPDWILSPASLQSDLQPKYEAIGCDWAFLNLRSVQGMYRSIQELGEIFDREEEAAALVEEFTSFYTAYASENEGKESPTVLVLMGLPGSYLIATENSYVGSLVALAGGTNVYAGTESEFLTVNTEDMLTKEADIILCASHGLPDSVMEMFAEEFATNDIWQHFSAVQNDQVYYLSYDLFGMSATFDYPAALEELQTYLYP